MLPWTRGFVDEMPLPLGPLCPFRSEFWGWLEERHSSLDRRAAELIFKRDCGERLDHSEEDELRGHLHEANDKWLIWSMRMRSGDDFQAMEIVRVVDVLLRKESLSMAMLEAVVRWQRQSLNAEAEGRLPPPPPRNVNMTALYSMSTSLSRTTSMLMTPLSVSLPFLSEEASSMESPVVRDEVLALMADHETVVKLGRGYRSFDPAGKIAYLDELESIKERWRIFYARVRLMGALSPELIVDGRAVVEAIGFPSVRQFHAAMDEVHRQMRAEATREAMLR